jgi:hypothetical protein
MPTALCESARELSPAPLLSLWPHRFLFKNMPLQKKFKKRQFFDRFLLSSSSFPFFFSYSSKFLTLYKCGFKELSRAQDDVFYLWV